LFVKEKMRFHCKACSRRSNFYPEIVYSLEKNRTVKYLVVRCPKCFAEGRVRYKRSS